MLKRLFGKRQPVIIKVRPQTPCDDAIDRDACEWRELRKQIDEIVRDKKNNRTGEHPVMSVR